MNDQKSVSGYFPRCWRVRSSFRPALSSPIAWLVLSLLIPATGGAARNQESDSLSEFVTGSIIGSDCDNWIGHTNEADELPLESASFTPFELSKQVGPQARTPRRDGAKDHDVWALNLTVETTDGDYRSANNIAGVNHSSEDGFDFRDAIEFTPRAYRYVQLYFPHPDWEILAENFTYDFRSIISNNRKTWEFTVRVNNLPDCEVELNWNSISEINNRYSFRLYNDDDDMLCDLRRTDSYRFRSDSTNCQLIKFKLTVAHSHRGNGQQDAEDNFVPAVNQFSLISVYPNPFNSTTTIRYEMQNPDDVTLYIYNLSGQRVKTVFEGYNQAGIHTATLNATELPSGLYLLRLEAGEKVATQKVRLVR